jgi:hypothetical protein
MAGVARRLIHPEEYAPAEASARSSVRRELNSVINRLDGCIIVLRLDVIVSADYDTKYCL